MRIQRSAPRLKIQRSPRWWSAHTHSEYSVNDAMGGISEMVGIVAGRGQKAMALTDHGNMAGSVELYKACRKHGIAAFPGSELYFVPDTDMHKKAYKSKTEKASRFHLGVMAYTTEGYENLVRLSTLSNENFFHKPLVDWPMLAQMAEDGRTAGLAITTGCYFGLLAQTFINQGEDAAKRVLATLEEYFPGSVYVEGQNHWITHDDGSTDDELADNLMGLADQMGMPYIVSQDSHYLHEEDQEDHDSLKRLVAFGPDADDAVFPGDGFHLGSEEWMQAHHHERRFERGVEGLQHLLAKNTLSIPVLDEYHYSVPTVVMEPQREMEQRCITKLDEIFNGKVPTKYLDKLAEEFEVIKAADMGGYMMLVAMITDYMTEQEIVYQTRGSAAGSLVCWLLDISNVDPLKWDLRFERFLSKDRTKPPDIDLDIAHDRRQEVVDFIDSRFVSHQIGSWAQYGITEEESDEFGETSRGSLLVRYFTAQGRKKQEDEEVPTKWSEIPHDDKVMLRRLVDHAPLKGMGTNAAGVVITSTRAEFDRLVPLAYMASRGGFVTQYAKDDIEALGLVKLDVLGSKTLTVVQRAMKNLNLPVQRLEDIEFRDAPSYRLMRSGSTEGLFQLEGNSTKWGLTKLKPNTIKDVIAAMALFRPAAMGSGGTDAYIRRKHKEEEVPERHELIAKVTAQTHGVMLYQEQVIDVLRAMGMEADDLTEFLKAVKASNKDIGSAGKVIEGYQAWIRQRCDELGLTGADKEFLDDAIAGFAEYGFNRAHATVYGITAYRTAYLATHHPVEFHAALLSVAAADPKKEPKYARATRKRGVRILPPEINSSKATYAVDTRRDCIRRGFRSISGIGDKIAEVLEQNAPYESLDDLVKRSPPRPVTGGKNYDGTPDSLNGALSKLYDSGCLDLLIHGDSR